MLGTEGTFDGARMRSGFANVLTGMMEFSTKAFLSAYDAVWPVFKPMLVGSVPLGGIAALLSYFVVNRMVTAYQAERRFANGRRERDDPSIKWRNSA